MQTMKTLKALGALLTYPSAELVAALPDLHAAIVDEAVVDKARRARLKALLRWMAEQDLLDLEEAYVELFDRGRATSLHLFEHVHGESRDRGQAMVDLKGMYRRAGLTLSPHELPDYLPAVLEYLSLRPAAEVKDMLGDCAHILRSLGAQLVKRDSPYAAVIDAVLAVAGEAGLRKGHADDAREEKSLDEEWAEEPVVFGPAAAPCSPPARRPGPPRAAEAPGRAPPA
jgi:nitrate reductase delta subunit